MERRAGPVLAWLLEHCLELRERLRGRAGFRGAGDVLCSQTLPEQGH